jgi:hypothetical protein
MNINDYCDLDQLSDGLKARRTKIDFEAVARSDYVGSGDDEDGQLEPR